MENRYASRRKSPRPAFLVALALAVVAWWLSHDPAPPAPRVVEAAPAAPPAMVGSLDENQTLSGLWAVHGLPAEDLVAVTEAGRKVFSWKSLRSGSEYRFSFARDGSLREFRVVLDRDRRLVARRGPDGFVARLIETPTVRRARHLTACIDGSPWQTLADAGEDPTLTITMAEILGGQVDFYTDIHPGDCFDVAFTVDERPDGSYRVASLDAVRLSLRARTHEAYLFAPDGERFDWYDAEGLSLKRRFLRSPLKYTRISSGFGMRRHPILRRPRPHHGVDYVAPVGTPVQASGDGVVETAGRNGGYGLYVKLRHGKRYHTSYAHLSRIASDVRRGVEVRQGQVIGYVGSTGMSTGAHLDYRFMKDGRYVDPLSADLPAADPLEGGELAAFTAHRDELRRRLEMGRAASAAGTIPADG